MTDKALFDALREAAAEIHRGHSGLGYHNWDHVTHAVVTHDRFFGVGTETSVLVQAQKLALYYHDAVYIPAAKLNEEASAKLFSWQVALAVGYSEYDRVHTEFLDGKIELSPDLSLLEACMFVPSWIQFTTAVHHLASGLMPQCVDAVLDCDLAAFAKPWSGFVAAQVAIMEEQMPGACNGEEINLSVLAKQANFLGNFLKKERIYRTPEMHTAFESVARENIKTLLEYVSQ